MAKNIAQIQDAIWLNIKKAQMCRGLVEHNYYILRLFKEAQNITQSEIADGTEMLGWHQIQLLEPQRHWGPISAVGADSEADYTGIYGSKASGNDLQKQVTISGCWQGESTSAMIAKFNGTQQQGQH